MSDWTCLPNVSINASLRCLDPQLSSFPFHKRFILEHELWGNLGNLNLCSQAIDCSYLAPKETVSDPFSGENCILDWHYMVCLNAGACMPGNVCGGQRATLWLWFSPLTFMWALRIEFRHKLAWQAPLPAEPYLWTNIIIMISIWDRACHWIWSLLIQLLTRPASRQHPLSPVLQCWFYSYGRLSLAFTWVLRLKLRSSCLLCKYLLTEPSPQPQEALGFQLLMAICFQLSLDSAANSLDRSYSLISQEQSAVVWALKTKGKVWLQASHGRKRLCLLWVRDPRGSSGTDIMPLESCPFYAVCSLFFFHI